MKKKLFVTDFDGTLLNDDKTISHEDIRTLYTLKKKNIITAIATGRSMYSFDKALKIMGMPQGNHMLPIDYIIFSTGAGIIEFSSRKIINQKNVKFSDIGKITNYFDHQKFDYMVHRSIPDTRHFLFKSHGEYNPDFHARIALYTDHAAPLPDGYCHVESATQVLAILPGKTDLDIVKKIQKDLSGFSVIHATSPLDHRSVWIEVFHKDVSKAKAASWLVKELGVNRRNVISLGNDYNDQDLLAWAEQGYVVENAPDSLKKMFKTVSSNNQSGLTMAVNKSGLLKY
ncbi:MAG: HAD family phosphatase [Desulfobacteraceae bacterium]|nr:HAD family phosphatase [Desulfobacteraceae bacterium]